MLKGVLMNNYDDDHVCASCGDPVWSADSAYCRDCGAQERYDAGIDPYDDDEARYGDEHLQGLNSLVEPFANLEINVADDAPTENNAAA